MSKKGGSYGTTTVSAELLAGSVSVEYVPVGSASAPMVESRPAASVTVSLNPAGHLPAVPGSVRFGWMGHDYIDNGQGRVFRVVPGGTDVESGTLNYATCTAVLDDWAVGPNPGTVTVKRLWTRRQRWTSGVIYGRTASAPIRPGAGGFVLTAPAMDGRTLVANVAATGEISGDEAWGAMDFASGAYQVMFGAFVLDASLTEAEKLEWWYDPADVGAVEAGKIWRPTPVDPTGLRYNAVTYIYLPIDAELMGLTPERLRPDGRAVVFRPGDYVVVGLTITGPAFAPSPQVYDTGAELLSSIDVIDANGGGKVLEGYTVDLDAGTLTITDTTDWPALVIVRGRAEVYRRIASASIDGTVRLTTPVGRAFPAGAVLSTALRYGNMQAHVLRVFDQYNWNGLTWLDYPTGDPSAGKYRNDLHAIDVTNLGAITERWAIRFKTSTTFDLYGEHLGLIASGTVNEDFAPPNPAAGNAPYLVLKALGWSGGFVNGNTVFVHTVGAEMPFALVRSTNPSTPSAASYDALFEIRCGKDTPPSNPFPN